MYKHNLKKHLNLKQRKSRTSIRQEVRYIFITDDGLNLIEQKAEESKDVKLLFMIQILRELRELKTLLQEKEKPGDSSNNSGNSTNYSK